MTIYVSNFILLIFMVSCLWVNSSSTSCSIFPSLNCSCFQSDADLHVSLPIKTYSHLHCQGNALTKKTFQSPFGVDFKYQNRFRTISLEFSIDKRLEIQTNQFNSLAMLSSQTDPQAQIEISLRFYGFTHFKFHPQSLTSTIFQSKHQNKRLWLHFIPATSKSLHQVVALSQGEFHMINNTFFI